MLRIHFTSQDLARTRLSPSLGPVTETVFALGLLSNSTTSLHMRWRHRLSMHLRQCTPLAGLLADRSRALQAPDDLLCLVDASPEADSGALRTLGLSRPEALDGVLEVWRSAVAPYWDKMLNHLEAECNTRGRITMTGGVDRLLDTLHSKVSWGSPVLELPGPDRDVRLRGRGLLLVPSFFLTHRPALLIGAEPDTGQPALVFAVPPNARQAERLWDEPANMVQALGALVGRTRAAALRALTASHTTTELAQELGISSAGASQHAAILREAGLITTHRNRNTVVHTVTPLGMALLGMEQNRAAGVLERAAIPEASVSVA
ncbi:Predicted transcriptional regulator [Streptomyces sp. SceaMP-e96]|uniref:ArsR/SmtB family transcription factor n=1 Tax=Streptomyces TaxID=1883 RepID=UPI000823EA95|nr:MULTISPECIES: helix-turn-helix domain-containing protein [unclassified Streptomyces]MYT16158.1 helix-turn-helix domain-containing protein [Streptomyces sp. SID4951]SCK30740.1 Predicted transcriptional regulator [Streptomyces sp. SceaMP-e96]